MIKKIEIENTLGKKLSIELRKPETSGLIVTSIDGLGPLKAIINVSEISTGDGGYLNSSRIPSRNIVFHFKFLMDPDIETVRHRTYKFFGLKRKVRMTFYTDYRTLEIEGIVESNEPDIFSKEEGTQISVICPNPYFFSGGENRHNETVFYGLESQFQFPFSNTANTREIIFGEIRFQQEQVIPYDGDAEVGMLIYIHCTGRVVNPEVYNARTRETFKLKGEYRKGDDIIINTNRGEKSVTLVRDNARTNILKHMTPDSKWLTLTNGDNLLAYSAKEGVSFMEFKVISRIIYEGI